MEKEILIEFDLNDRYGAEYVTRILEKIKSSRRGLDTISFPDIVDSPEFFLVSVNSKMEMIENYSNYKIENYSNFEIEFIDQDRNFEFFRNLGQIRNSTVQITFQEDGSMKIWRIDARNIGITINNNVMYSKSSCESGIRPYMEDSLRISLSFSTNHLVEE